MKNQIREKCIAIGLALMLIGVVIQPAAAWGSITHLAIASELSGVSGDPKYIRGGSVGIDMFYFLPGKECYSVLAHTSRTRTFSLNMLRSASTDKEKAYAYGHISHHESDVIGHTAYVNRVSDPSDPLGHAKVELGVDANVAFEKDPSLTFSVAYGPVQKAYRNTYSEIRPPGLITIISAATVQATALFIEEFLIRAGAFDDLKNTYTWDGYDSFPGFGPVYIASISESNSAIISPYAPTSLPDVNLYTGFPAASEPTCSVTSLVSSNLNKANHIKVDPDIRDTANELLRKGVIEVPTRDDKINQVLDLGEPIVKDKKAFDDTIAELVKKKKGK